MVGLGLGFTMLLVFSDQGKTAVKPSAAVSESQKKTEQGEKASTLNVKDLPLKINVIQGGVFTKTEQVDKVTRELRKKEVPAIAVKNGGETAIYIGLMTNETKNNILANYYKKRKIGFYEKNWRLSAAEHPLVLKKNQQLADFIGKGQDI
ncbi:hypothetical protein QS257_08080 [Terrilactibacillus sp. S3-3]|nr:hypothetical protein QS257_08080 [Terrilactibacillus sp. S3-3]